MSAAQTRSKILDAMYNLIAEQGYERASIGRIAEIVQVKKAAIYYYYKKKEDILFDLIDIYFKEYPFDYAFYKASNYEEYKTCFKSFGLKIIADYRNNITLRKVIAEINLLAQRNEEVNKKIGKYDKNFEMAVEKLFKHGLSIEALNENFNVKLNTNMILLFFGGIENSITFNYNIDVEEAWLLFVNKII